jgi:hypothetical protein
MIPHFRHARRLAAVALLAGLWGPVAARAQDGVPLPPISSVATQNTLAPRAPASPITLVQAPLTDRALTAGQETSAGIAFGGQPPGQAADKKDTETCWSRIPDLAPSPRTGDFLLPPSGKGYYYGLDFLLGKKVDTAPAYPYRNVFYDNDFRYLDRTDGEEVDCFDALKRVHFGDGGCPCDACGKPQGFMFSMGGEERLQLKNEIDGANGRLLFKDNNYQLLRTRVYGDLWYKDWVRVYVEYIDAQSYNQDLPPLAIDVNRSDLLNAFVDLKVAEIDGHPAYLRVGRQELQYGSQRLVSPLDWANTRRTFEGAKVFWHSDNLDVDAFWTRPVVVSPSHFDAGDANRQFAGAFLTYRPAEGQAIDAYYFYLDSDLAVTFGATPGGRGGYDLNTFGGRWSGDHPLADVFAGLKDSWLAGNILWDVEGGYQFGDYSNRFASAGFSSSGLGYAFRKLPMQPQLWAYFDYASGTPDRNGAGTFATFNQLFPFGHYYLGFLDEVGRENIHDWNFQLTFYPTKWITGLVQYHVFRLDQAKDALYGTSPGYPTERFDPTGKAGTQVGDELDVVGTFQLDRHNSLQFGYSKFFSGSFIKQTGPPVNPELYYMQYAFRW